MERTTRVKAFYGDACRRLRVVGSPPLLSDIVQAVGTSFKLSRDLFTLHWKDVDSDVVTIVGTEDLHEAILEQQQCGNSIFKLHVHDKKMSVTFDSLFDDSPLSSPLPLPSGLLKHRRTQNCFENTSLFGSSPPSSPSTSRSAKQNQTIVSTHCIFDSPPSSPLFSQATKQKQNDLRFLFKSSPPPPPPPSPPPPPPPPISYGNCRVPLIPVGVNIGSVQPAPPPPPPRCSSLSTSFRAPPPPQPMLYQHAPVVGNDVDGDDDDDDDVRLISPCLVHQINKRATFLAEIRRGFLLKKAPPCYEGLCVANTTPTNTTPTNTTPTNATPTNTTSTNITPPNTTPTNSTPITTPDLFARLVAALKNRKTKTNSATPTHSKPMRSTAHANPMTNKHQTNEQPTERTNEQMNKPDKTLEKTAATLRNRVRMHLSPAIERVEAVFRNNCTYTLLNTIADMGYTDVDPAWVTSRLKANHGNINTVVSELIDMKSTTTSTSIALVVVNSSMRSPSTRNPDICHDINHPRSISPTNCIEHHYMNPHHINHHGNHHHINQHVLSQIRNDATANNIRASATMTSRIEEIVTTAHADIDAAYVAYTTTLRGSTHGNTANDDDVSNTLNDVNMDILDGSGFWSSDNGDDDDDHEDGDDDFDDLFD